MDDAEYTRAVFQRLRPNVPKWLPDWLDAYLIVIDLMGKCRACSGATALLSHCLQQF